MAASHANGQSWSAGKKTLAVALSATLSLTAPIVPQTASASEDDNAQAANAAATAANGVGETAEVALAVGGAPSEKKDISKATFFPWNVGDQYDKAYVNQDGTFSFNADDISVEYEGADLVKGADYTYEYQDENGKALATKSGTPEAPGQYKLVFTGKGDYAGTHEIDFEALGSYQQKGNGPAWAYSLNDDGEGGGITLRWRVPDTTPVSAEDWIMPSSIDGKPVTRIEANTSETMHYFFSSSNANTITFPASLTKIEDASQWGGYILADSTFSGNTSAAGYVFFLGACPDGFDWKKVASSDPYLKIYTPAEYVDGWKASLQKAGYSGTTVSECVVPGVQIVAGKDDASLEPVEKIQLRPGQSIDAAAKVVAPEGKEDEVFSAHAKVTWTTTDDAVAEAGTFGNLIYADENAKVGSKATVTATNAVGATDSVEVEIVGAPEGPTYTDQLGVEWQYQDNGDGTATITGFKNDKSFIKGKDVVVPSYLGGLKVTGIDSTGSIFRSAEAKTITLPQGLKSVTNPYYFFDDAATDGIYLTGDYDASLDWGQFSNPSITFYAPTQYYDNWKASFLWQYYLESYGAPTGIEVRHGGEAASSISTYAGKTVRLSATNLPEGGTFLPFHSQLAWSSSDEKVATVDENGAVSVAKDAAAGAKATVTVTDGVGNRANVEVVVEQAPAQPVDVSRLTFTPDAIPDVYANDGKPSIPEVAVSDPDGKKLVAGEDYTVSYKKADGTALDAAPAEVGDYVMVISGEAPAYTGVKELPFTISDTAAVAGWQFAKNADGTTATITKYVGDAETAVVPGQIAGLTVTGVAAGAFVPGDKDQTGAETVVVPDTVTTLAEGSLASENVMTVRFLGKAPAGLDKALGSGAAVQAFAGEVDAFKAAASGHDVAAITDNPWAYQVRYDAAGNATGVLGASDKTIAYKGDKLATVNVPSEIDGVALDTIGADAFTGMKSDDGWLLVSVPDSYRFVEPMAFDGMATRGIAFTSKTPFTKVGDGDIASSLSDVPTLWVPLGCEDAYKNSPWASSETSWGSVMVSEWDTQWQVSLEMAPKWYTSGTWAAVVTGHVGELSGKVTSVPVNVFYQDAAEYRDLDIDGSKILSFDMVDQAFYGFAMGKNTKFTGTFLKNFKGSIRFHEDPPTADDYAKVINPDDADKSKVTIFYDPAKKDAWLASGWAKAGYNLQPYSDAAEASFTYEKTADGEYAVTGYSGDETDITIPENVTVAGKSGKVTSIADGAFQNTAANLTSVKIPGSVKRIGASAFENQGQLTSVTIPEGVESIADRAFWSCSKLAKVDLPASLTTLEGAPFEATGVEAFTVAKGSKSFSA